MDWGSLYAEGVARHLDYPRESILDAWERAVSRQHGAPCTEFLGRVRSFDDVDAEVRRVAAGLHSLGVGPGERVAVLLPTCPQSLVATLATFLLGAEVVHHNPLYTAEELQPQMADHGARVAVAWDKVAPVVHTLTDTTPLEHVVAVDLTSEMPRLRRAALRLPVPALRRARARLTGPVHEHDVLTWSALQHRGRLPEELPRPGSDDVAVVLYTSGTTGAAKGVPLTHANLLANCRQGVEWAGLEWGQEVFLAALPTFHALGLTVSVLVAVLNGCLVEMVPAPDAALMLAAIRRRTPTFVTGVPPIFAAIHRAATEHGVSLQGIRTGLSGAMPLDPDFVAHWEAATGGRLIEGYGLTECSPIVVGNPISPARRPGAIGVPFPDTHARVVSTDDPHVEVAPGEEGELVVRGPQVFAGYLGRPEDTAEAFVDGWFRTGDLVRQQDGFLVVSGRLKEIIVTGGFNVAPAEVEQVLRRHPAVVDAAVVGLPSASGEDVVAAVVVDGVLPETPEMRRWCKKHLAAYKVPRRFVVVDELPTNAMGKVSRREVQDALRG